MSFALTSYPFDTQSVSESQWGQMAQLWLGDGVLAGILNELQVVGDSTGMQIKVASGRCWIQGFFGENPAQQTLAIAAAHATLNRTDRVVLRLDLTNNQILLDVLTGIAGGAVPSLTRSATVWELSLAQVAIAATVTTIAAGNVTDERNNQTFEGSNTTGVCGYAYSTSPHARCISTHRPTKWPLGGTIFEDDTGFVLINTGTYAVPVWTRAGPAVFAVPALTFSTSNAIGAANTYMRSDAQLAIFETASPSTQAIGDAAVVGTQPFAARRDHKHAMPTFATPTIALSTAAAPGAAATPMRSDATIVAFDATVPTTSAQGDAANAGAINFAARRDHVHGRESSVHLFVYKVANQQVAASTTLVNDADLFLAIPASSIWAFDLYLILRADSNTPSIKLVWGADSASGTVSCNLESTDYAPGAVVPLAPQPLVTLAQPPVVVPLYVAIGGTPARVQGIYRNTGVATTLRLKWAQNVSNASATYVDAGSHVVAHRMA